MLKAINHPKDKWEAAFHLGDKIYPRSQEWAKVKEYMDIASTASPTAKVRPTPNDKKNINVTGGFSLISKKL